MFYDQPGVAKKSVARLLLLSSAIVGIAGPASADQFTDAYDASPYSFCDAVMVGVLYGVDGVEGKSKIGANILQGGGYPEVERLLAQARAGGVQCNFEDTGYQFADAQAVAGIWGVPIDQAKTKIAEIVSAGNRAALDRAIATAPRG